MSCDRGLAIFYATWLVGKEQAESIFAQSTDAEIEKFVREAADHPDLKQLMIDQMTDVYKNLEFDDGDDKAD